MRTERVTILTPDHRAALDASAREAGMSMGHVLREAPARYLAGREMDAGSQLQRLVQEMDSALPGCKCDRRVNC